MRPNSRENPPLTSHPLVSSPRRAEVRTIAPQSPTVEDGLLISVAALAIAGNLPCILAFDLAPSADIGCISTLFNPHNSALLFQATATDPIPCPVPQVQYLRNVDQAGGGCRGKAKPRERQVLLRAPRQGVRSAVGEDASNRADEASPGIALIDRRHSVREAAAATKESETTRPAVNSARSRRIRRKHAGSRPS